MEEAQRLCDRIGILAGGKRVAEGAPQELVTRVLAREALELDASPAEEAEWAHGLAGVRRLRVGGRLFLFADDAGGLRERLRPRLGGRERSVVARPAHLEDVFLALTGTRLEGGA
jgi:lipooligosaccharide transport system ATP-binding protein